MKFIKGNRYAKVTRETTVTSGGRANRLAFAQTPCQVFGKPLRVSFTVTGTDRLPKASAEVVAHDKAYRIFALLQL